MRTLLPNLKSVAAGLALASLLPLDALAVPVAPGAASTALPGTTFAARPELGGTVLADVSSSWVGEIDPLYGFPGATGTLQSRVVRETSTGFLDFYWRISVAPPSYPNYVPTLLTIANLALGNFLTGSVFDADYRTDGLGTTAPTSARASADASSLSYEFSRSTFGPGSSSYFLLLHSNATAYDSSALASIGTSSFATFAPVPAVPEASTYALMLAGLGAVGVITRRRGGRSSNVA